MAKSDLQNVSFFFSLQLRTNDDHQEEEKKNYENFLIAVSSNCLSLSFLLSVTRFLIKWQFAFLFILFFVCGETLSVSEATVTAK